MLLEVLVISGVNIVCFAVFLVWTRSRSQNDSERIQAKVSDALQRPILDLAERMTRISSEMKDSVTERLGKHFLESQERVERTLGQNRQELQTGLSKTTVALETKFQSLEQQVGIRLENIGKSVESKLNENLKEGFKHFEKVQQHLAAAELKLASLNTVGQGISDLNNLLKLPHLRGGFGEASLERLLADFLPNGQYELQYAVVPNAPERVDAIVRLAKQVLPIDSKFPREQVLPLFEESKDPQALEEARRTLGEIIRAQAKSIADKYIRPDHGTTDMALMFLPSETLYFEVIRNGKVFEQLTKYKVFPVSPNTLAISLKSVAMAQEYYEMARGVEKTIEDVKKARRHFQHFERKFEELGKGLKKAQEAFETASTHLGHYESSVFRMTGELESIPEGDVALAPGVPALPPGAQATLFSGE
jgi:DNA recombination protein RmuC